MIKKFLKNLFSLQPYPFEEYRVCSHCQLKDKKTVSNCPYLDKYSIISLWEHGVDVRSRNSMSVRDDMIKAVVSAKGGELEEYFRNLKE